MNIDSVLKNHGIGGGKYKKNSMIPVWNTSQRKMLIGRYKQTSEILKKCPTNDTYVTKINIGFRKYSSFEDFISGTAEFDISRNGIRNITIDNLGNIILATATALEKRSPQGTLLWRYPQYTDADFQAVTCDNDGNIYATAYGSAMLYKFNSAGDMIWRFSAFTYTYSILYIKLDSLGNIFCGAYDSVNGSAAYKVSADGISLVWWKSTGIGLKTIELSSDEQYLYTSSYNGFLQKIVVDDGSLVWQGTSTTKSNYLLANKDGDMFIGGSDGKVLIYDKDFLFSDVPKAVGHTYNLAGNIISYMSIKEDGTLLTFGDALLEYHYKLKII